MFRGETVGDLPRAGRLPHLGRSEAADRAGQQVICSSRSPTGRAPISSRWTRGPWL
jgi:hypothetical protein